MFSAAWFKNGVGLSRKTGSPRGLVPDSFRIPAKDAAYHCNNTLTQQLLFHITLRIRCNHCKCAYRTQDFLLLNTINISLNKKKQNCVRRNRIDFFAISGGGNRYFLVANILHVRLLDWHLIIFPNILPRFHAIWPLSASILLGPILVAIHLHSRQMYKQTYQARILVWFLTSLIFPNELVLWN